MLLRRNDTGFRPRPDSIWISLARNFAAFPFITVASLVQSTPLISNRVECTAYSEGEEAASSRAAALLLCNTTNRLQRLNLSPLVQSGSKVRFL